MHDIWELGRCSVSDLIAAVPDPKPPHSSVSTIVRVLEKKGFVGHEEAGRSFIYFALVSKEAYSRASIQGLAESYFGGSMQRLVSFIVREKDLTKAELEELMRKL